MRQRVWATWVAAIFVGTLLLGLLGSASLPLDSHEVRPALAASGMLRTGDWIVPRANGDLRLEKPPMGPWLMAISHRALGGSDDERIGALAARLPSIFAAAGLALCAMGLCRVAYIEMRSAVVAGVVTGVSVGSLQFSHSARPEMVYAFFCALMLLSALMLVQPRSEKQRWGTLIICAIGMSIALAGALLTKGPFLPLMLLLGAAIGLIIRGRRFVALRWLPSIVLGFSGLGLWVWLVTQHMPDALEYWRHEMFDRTGGASGGSWTRLFEGYYLYATLPLIAPWFVLIPAGVINPWKREVEEDEQSASGSAIGDRSLRMALWWSVAMPMFLLSFSDGRHTYYMLPALVAIGALGAGEGIGDFLRPGRKPEVRGSLAHRLITIHGAIFVTLAIGLAVAVILMSSERGVSAAERWAALALVLVGGAFSVAALWRHTLGLRWVMLALSCWCVLASAAISRIAWSVKRHQRWEFAEQATAFIPSPGRLVARGVDPWLFAYVSDQVVGRVNDEELAAMAQEGAEFAAIISVPRADLPVAGRVAIQTPPDSEDGAMALVVYGPATSAPP